MITNNLFDVCLPSSPARFALAFWLAACCGSDVAPANADDREVKSSGNWPQWRGPLSTGAAPYGDPPVEWSETKNVRWKMPLPGKGHSTPVVWGDRVYLTAAIPFGEKFEGRPDTAPGAHDNVLVTQRHRFVVLAVNRADGNVVWRKTMKESVPREGGHYTGTPASHSPATDGERVYAYFGSQGLYCLDLDGNIVWSRDFGEMHTKHAHGEGSSPALYKDTLVVNWDHEEQSFVAALDARTGKTRWKVERDEVTSWASPIVVEHEGRPQAIVAGTDRVRSYDLATGRVVWQCGGLSHNIVATPVAGDGMVFTASSYDTRALLAITLAGATGDVTGAEQVAWSRTRLTPYVPSLLLYGGSLYYLRHYQGVLSRVEAKTGKEKHGPFRLGGITDVYASPVAAAGRVYITDRDGTTLVISHGDKPGFLARNLLDDSFSASAAIAGDEMFLRGERFLYCLARDAGN